MRLLISVTDEEEALAAIRGGADIIDVKNPEEGTLGANFPSVIKRVCQITPAHLEVSATIGDVPNLPGMVSLTGLGAAVCGVDYVKVGLFGVHRADEAIFLLRKVNQAVKGWDLRIKVIAAGYADAHKVGSLAPLLVPDVAAAADADGCLLDTACKGEGHLLRLLTTSQLESFVQECRAHSLLCALAGSLSEAQLPLLERLGVDIVGIRSAACQGDRIRGRIDKHKVRQLKKAITPSVGTFPESSLPLSAPPAAQDVRH